MLPELDDSSASAPQKWHISRRWSRDIGLQRSYSTYWFSATFSFLDWCNLHRPCVAVNLAVGFTIAIGVSSRAYRRDRVIP